MALTVTHALVSAIADDPVAAAAGEVVPSDWNAGHQNAVSAFNVTDYGAIGDGSNDDTAEIQAALDAANAAGGGTVWIPAGTYKISNSLIVYSDTHVRGAGRGATTLRGTAGAYAGRTINGGSPIYCTIAMVTANRSSVKSLTVDHVTNATTANGIGILYDGTEVASTMCVIEDCQVLGYDSHQYLIWNYKGIGSKILNNYLDGSCTTRDGSVGQEGIETYGGSDVLISGNTVKNIDANAIFAWGDANSGYPNNITICDNYVTVSLDGVRVLSPAYNVHVFNNHCEACWDAGIKVTCATGETLDDIAIVANTVDTADIGIFCTSETGGLTKRTLIEGNSIRSTDLSTSAGIHVQAFSDCNVVNNNIKDSAGRGIYIEVGSNAKVCGNVIDTADYNGIRFYDVSKGQILGNSVLEFNNGNTTSPGILIDISNDILIDHNSFKWTTGQYAISVASSGSDRCTIGGGNQLLQTSYANPTYQNAGTNPNRSTVTIAANATTTTVYNTLVNPSSQIAVRQTAGGVNPWVVNNVGHGGFDIVTAPAVGDETYAYEIA